MIRCLALVLALAACSSATSTIAYPDNSQLPPESFIDIGKAITSLHAGDAARIDIRKDTRGHVLLRWSQIVTPTIAQNDVSPGRMVYEITATYTHPFRTGPNRYRSGQRTTVVDAQTGRWICILARGNLATGAMRPL